MLIIVFYYFNIELREDLLPEEFISRNYVRYIVIIGSFIFSLFCLISISLTFLRKKDVVIVNSKNVLVANRIVKNKLNQINNISYIDDSIQLYNKKVDGFSSGIFRNYNILIIIYMFFLTIYFFISKNEENINFFQDAQTAERKMEELLIQEMEGETKHSLRVGDSMRKKTLLSRKKKKIEEEDNYSLTNKGKSWWSNDDIDENDIYRLNRRRKQDEDIDNNNEEEKIIVKKKKLVKKKKKKVDDEDEEDFNASQNGGKE